MHKKKVKRQLELQTIRSVSKTSYKLYKSHFTVAKFLSLISLKSLYIAVLNNKSDPHINITVTTKVLGLPKKFVWRCCRRHHYYHCCLYCILPPDTVLLRSVLSFLATQFWHGSSHWVRYVTYSNIQPRIKHRTLWMTAQELTSSPLYDTIDD